MPAIAALSRLASVPARIARKPNFAISGRRDGASPPNPPSKIANEERLANPQSANEIIATDFSLNISS